jgi:hypothetical protein
MLHVSALKDYYKAQKMKWIAAKDFEYFIKACIIWGLLEKLQKATIGFVLSVCPSVRVEQIVAGSHWKDSGEIWYLRTFIISQ